MWSNAAVQAHRIVVAAEVYLWHGVPVETSGLGVLVVAGQEMARADEGALPQVVHVAAGE